MIAPKERPTEPRRSSVKDDEGGDKTNGGCDGRAVWAKMELLIDHQSRVPAKITQQKPSSPCGPSMGFDRAKNVRAYRNTHAPYSDKTAHPTKPKATHGGRGVI